MKANKAKLMELAVVCAGDTVLWIKKEWIDLIFHEESAKRKTMEVRNGR